MGVDSLPYLQFISYQTKVVVQIDELGAADPIPFGIGGPPHVSIRLQPLAGAVCRFKVTSIDTEDINEEEVVQSIRVPERIVTTSM